MKRILAVALALLTALPVFAANDKVLKKGDAKPLEGKVEKEDMKGLTIKMEGKATTTLTWDQVASVEYGDAPIEYREAKSAFEKSDYAAALDWYGKAVEKVKDRPNFMAHVMYGSGWCQQLLGKYDDAIKSYKDLMTANADNKYFKQAWENIIECNLKKNDAAAASAAIAEATAAAKTAGLTDDFTMRLKLKEGQVAEAAHDFSKATGLFQAVEDGANAWPAIKFEASLGVGRCQMESNLDAAQATFEKITREAKGQRGVLGSAWAMLGDCLAKQAEKAKDQEKYKRATLAYLNTVVSYFPPEGTSTADYERALCNGGETFLSLADLAETPKGKELYATEARSLVQSLLDQFPASQFKAKAEALRARADEMLAKIKPK